ncbi:hypothetical protein [Rhodococcus sp. 27YEA15]|uniref:hypothetical protein n=1 Tax=Rhodococcus sp. 27YEA15 TaxID=3156259 RepID=UPI003C7B4C2A
MASRSLTEGFDTTTPGGEFLFHIMSALAQMERAHAGLEAAIRQGRHGGRPTAMTAERTETAKTLRAQGKPSTASPKRSASADPPSAARYKLLRNRTSETAYRTCGHLSWQPSIRTSSDSQVLKPSECRRG